MKLGLDDKVALIAGSSKGLGFATANILLEEGAYVVLNSRSSDSLDQAASSLGIPERVMTASGDTTHPEICKSIVEKVIQNFGRLDILVTNCGGPSAGDFENLTDADWDDAISKSLKSHIYLIRSSLPFLKNSDNASILTITSFTVKQPLPNMVLSNSIRAATAALTKSLSKEFGKYQIRVNSILPGWTYTDRVEDLIKTRSKASELSIEEETALISSSIPLGRLGKTEEFAKAAAFLVSPAASFINGVMLNVDGGLYQGLF